MQAGEGEIGLVRWTVGDQQREHAQVPGGLDGAKLVVNHQAAGRIAFPGQAHGDPEGLGHRLAVRGDRHHVHDGVEHPVQAESGDDPPGVAAVGVGEDQVAGREGFDHGPQAGVRAEVAVEGQVVDEGQEVGFIHLVIGHQAAQGGAVLAEILFAQVGDLLRREAHPLAHVNVHALLDLHPQAGGGRVEGVVEVEENGGDVHAGIID